MKETWRQQMQQKMADYQKPAPELPWEDIEKKVAANKQKGRVIPLWTRKVAAAILVLLVTVGGYQLLNHKTVHLSDDKETISRQQPKQEGQRETTDPTVDSSERLTEPTSTKHLVATLQNPVKELVTKQDIRNNVGTEGDTMAQATETVDADTVKRVVKDREHSSTGTKSVTPSDNPTILYPSDMEKSKEHQGRLTAKVYLSNAVANGNINNSAMRNEPLYDSSSSYMGYTQDGDKSQSVYYPEIPSQIIIGTPTVETNEKAEHHQPLRFGFSLRYRINNRWSVESGLTYTRLTSDILRTSNGITVSMDQRLSYIGIPLHVTYQLWDTPHFDIYASMGGMAEKMVNGKRTSDISSESVTIHPLQFSVNGGIGAAYMLNNQFSIYAEPGLNYYFDNGSSIPTFYQDKPFNFSLNVGLRFDFK